MSRTVNYAKCPSCGKEYSPGFNNYWMSSAFGEYSSNYTNHICDCGIKFRMDVEKQVVYKTKIIKEDK